MNYREKREPSSPDLDDVLGQLIYQALSAEVRGTEPSPRVWKNIYQGAIDIRDARLDKKPRGFSLSFLSNLLAFLSDENWEDRLSRQRPMPLWSDYLLLVA